MSLDGKTEIMGSEISGRWKERAEQAHSEVGLALLAGRVAMWAFVVPTHPQKGEVWMGHLAGD
jgi:hypothetical protein